MFNTHKQKSPQTKRGVGIRYWTILIAATATNSLAHAAELGAGLNSRTPESAADNFSMSSDYLVQVILALILVIAVMFVLSFLVRRFSMFQGVNAGPIKILSALPLGGKDKLLLVQVGEEQLLLGASPGNVQKVHKLETTIAAGNAPESTSGGKQGFASILNSITRG